MLPTIVALTLAPALMPSCALCGTGWGNRPPAALAVIAGLVVVVGSKIVAMSVVSQYDELAEAVRRGASEITAWLEGEPFKSPGTVQNLDSSLGDIWSGTSTTCRRPERGRLPLDRARPRVAMLSSSCVTAPTSGAGS